MSRWRRRTLSLGLGSNEMALVDLAAGPSPRPLSMLPLAEYLPGADAPELANWEPSVATVFAQSEIKGGGDLHVTVSDDWVRYWFIQPPEGLRSFSELRAMAENRFETLFGVPMNGWAMQADWRAGSSMLACALPTRLLDAMQTLSKRYSFRILSAQPQAIRLMNATGGQVGNDVWVCSFSTRSFLAILFEGGQLIHARQFRFDAPLSIEDMYIKLESELLRMGMDMPEEICLQGYAPPVRGDERIGSVRLKVLKATGGFGTKVSEPAGKHSDAYLLALCGGVT